MRAEDRIGTFIYSLDQGNTEFLDSLEAECIKDGVPIIRPQTQSLLKTLLALLRPSRILEIGTAVGFSALLMSEYAPSGCRITTIEKYEKRIPLARENFARSSRGDQITLLEGDAAEILPALTGSYDLIFMDAAKGQYQHFLPDVLRLLRCGGVLVSDNVLQEGEILESRFAVTRRNRTIHARMREYLYVLKHHELLETVILSDGDGAAVSVKKQEESESESDVKK